VTKQVAKCVKSVPILQSVPIFGRRLGIVSRLESKAYHGDGCTIPGCDQSTGNLNTSGYGSRSLRFAAFNGFNLGIDLAMAWPIDVGHGDLCLGHFFNACLKVHRLERMHNFVCSICCRRDSLVIRLGLETCNLAAESWHQTVERFRFFSMLGNAGECCDTRLDSKA
jgi:hypothetical protein